MGKAIEVILSSKVVGSIIIVLISIVVFLIIKESTLKYIAKKRRRADLRQKKRLTILNLCISIVKYVIFITDIVIILGIFDIKVTAFLAGLGIFGIVI